MKVAQFPGNELRQRREELGLSPADVYRRTRIPMPYLAAMEQGNVADLPPKCYALGFIRTYCRFLGLEPERFCDCLHACTQPPPGRFLRRHASSAGWSRPVWFNEAAAWFGVCLIIAFTWFAYTILLRPNADVTDSHVDAGAVKMVVPPAPDELDY
jgi:hypothetical protein